MSLPYPIFMVQDVIVALSGRQVDHLPPVGDRLDRLLEAGNTECCAGGDFVALMPSVDVPARPWSDDRTWVRRILGF